MQVAPDWCYGYPRRGMEGLAWTRLVCCYQADQEIEGQLHSQSAVNSNISPVNTSLGPGGGGHLPDRRNEFNI